MCGLPWWPSGKKKKKLPANAGNARDRGSISGLVSFPRGGNITHSSILALKIP